jgi:hypothetical protein
VTNVEAKKIKFLIIGGRRLHDSEHLVSLFIMKAPRTKFGRDSSNGTQSFESIKHRSLLETNVISPLKYYEIG